MANLPSSESKLNDVEVAQDAPVSEAVVSKMGSNVNYAIDKNATQDSRLTAVETRAAAARTQINAMNVVLQKVGSEKVIDIGTDLAAGEPQLFVWKDFTASKTYLLVRQGANIWNHDLNVNPSSVTWDAFSAVFERRGSGTLYTARVNLYKLHEVTDIS